MCVRRPARRAHPCALACAISHAPCHTASCGGRDVFRNDADNEYRANYTRTNACIILEARAGRHGMRAHDACAQSLKYLSIIQDYFLNAHAAHAGARRPKHVVEYQCSSAGVAVRRSSLKWLSTWLRTSAGSVVTVSSRCLIPYREGRSCDMGISPEATLMLRCTCFGFASCALFARSVSFRSAFLFAFLMMVAISFRHIEGISCSSGWYVRFKVRAADCMGLLMSMLGYSYSYSYCELIITKENLRVGLGYHYTTSTSTWRHFRRFVPVENVHAYIQ